MHDWTHWLDFDRFVPMDLLVIGVLVVLEGLLSCDNAVVLALLVKDLPPQQRGRALRYGILGAYAFRILALAVAAWIMSKWYLKVLGGLYLVWIAYRHFRRHEDEQPSEKMVRRLFGLSPFWSTVIAVELTDIVFSVDSIAAAVALSDKMFVLVAGALFGILAMRFAAQGFVKLLATFPRLETAAFVAVAVIGGKLALEFPMDVLGRTRPFPDGATYATAAEYRALVDAHAPSFLRVDHIMTINLAAPPEPRRDVMQAALTARTPSNDDPAAQHARWHEVEREFLRAESAWNLHYRPFLEIEGWVSSLVILIIFAFGFRRK